MKKIFFLLFFFIFDLDAVAQTTTLAGKNVIIFVPGLYGSALVDDSTATRRFLTFSEAIWGHKPLALRGDQLGIAGALSLREDGLLNSVSILPYVYSIDAYGDS